MDINVNEMCLKDNELKIGYKVVFVNTF